MHKIEILLYIYKVDQQQIPPKFEFWNAMGYLHDLKIVWKMKALKCKFVVYANKSNQTILLIYGLLTIYISIKSYCFHPIFGPTFTPKPLFWWYPQCKEILLNMGLKC